ncbi:MAG TPA: hypothetical protein VGH99_24010 [Pseudonocardia sp.]
MPDTATAPLELGGLFFGLGVLGRLASRIGVSPVPLYLLGGLAFGTGGLIPLSGISEFTEPASEVGVVLLLGLEYTATDLVPGLRQSCLDFWTATMSTPVCSWRLANRCRRLCGPRLVSFAALVAFTIQ